MADSGGRGWKVMVLDKELNGDLAATVSLIAEALPALSDDDLIGRIHRERVDAVVFDAVGAKIDPVKLITDLRERQKSTRFLPILAAVDRSEVLLREKLLNAGATDVIDLPLEVIETRARLEHVLRSRGWHAQLAEAGATLDRERRETAAARQELMPRVMPTVDGWDFAARVRHMGRFTGDSYDVFPAFPNRMVISVADALGSDVVSLIRLAMVRAWVRSSARRAQNVSELLAEVNELMLDTFGDDGRFVTLYMGFLDPTTARLTHGCAGFVEPVLWGSKTAGQISLEVTGGPPLGVTREAIYRESTIEMEAGTRLILGTHALQRERRSPGSLAGRIAEGVDLSAQHMVEKLAIDEPQPSAANSSGMRDVTFLVIQRRAAVKAS